MFPRVVEKYELFSTIAKGTIYVAYWLTAKAHEFCMNCSSDDICNNTFVVFFQATPTNLIIANLQSVLLAST